MRYIVGSNYFFQGLAGFHPKDVDVFIVEDSPQEYKDMRESHFGNKCVFEYKSRSKEEWLELFENTKLPMAVGKALNKEFANAIGMTVEDLKMLGGQFEKMDGKHLYEQYIYECYQENHAFKLTDKQREHAYKLYKEERQ